VKSKKRALGQSFKKKKKNKPNVVAESRLPRGPKGTVVGRGVVEKITRSVVHQQRRRFSRPKGAYVANEYLRKGHGGGVDAAS